MKFQTHRLFQIPNGLTITLAAIALKSVLDYLQLTFPGDEVVVIVLAIGAAALRWLNMRKDQIMQPSVSISDGYVPPKISLTQPKIYNGAPAASPYAAEFTRGADGVVSVNKVNALEPVAEGTGEKIIRFLIG